MENCNGFYLNGCLWPARNRYNRIDMCTRVQWVLDAKILKTLVLIVAELIWLLEGELVAISGHSVLPWLITGSTASVGAFLEIKVFALVSVC